MHSARRQIAALTVFAFLGVAVLCVETNRAALRRHASIGSRAPENRPAPFGQLKAFKRSTYVEEEGALSESPRVSWRTLSSRERRGETPGARLHLLSLPGFILTPKVSTNLLLSVLNL